MASRVRVEIVGDKELIAKLGGVRAIVGKVLVKAAEAGAQVIENEAERRAPGPHVGTELVEEETTSTRATVAIGPDRDHWYYRFFETGATRHEIDPHRKKALAFEAGGEGIVRTLVNHPGMPAEPFLRPAIDNRKEAASQETGDVFWAAIEGASG